jgi:death on curing protein
MCYPQAVADLLLRVYEIHEYILAKTGGLEGLRDGTMLHAAVSRPFASFAGQDLYPDDFEKAAALFHSLIKSHPFLDGTKRTALAVALYFLEQCGHRRRSPLPEEEVIRFCLAVAEENLRLASGESIEAKSIAEISAWFRSLVKNDSFIRV